MRRMVVIILAGMLVMTAAGAVADEHESGSESTASTAEADSAKTEAEVENLAPAVQEVVVTTDDDPSVGGSQVAPVPNKNTDVDLEVLVSDGNGWEDVRKVSCALIAPSGTVVDDKIRSGKDLGGQGTVGRFSVGSQIPKEPEKGTWTLDCWAEDKSQKQNLNRDDVPSELHATTTFVVNGLAAIAIVDATVDFTGGAAIVPGVKGAPNPVLVENRGNVEVDLHLSGTDLGGPSGASIPVARVEVASSESMENAQALSQAGIDLLDFDLPAGYGEQKQVWFTLSVPTGEEQYIPAGKYTGKVTIAALATE